MNVQSAVCYVSQIFNTVLIQLLSPNNLHELYIVSMHDYRTLSGAAFEREVFYYIKTGFIIPWNVPIQFMEYFPTTINISKGDRQDKSSILIQLLWKKNAPRRMCTIIHIPQSLP